MPGHYGDKKKKRPSKMMPPSFPKAQTKKERSSTARTGSFPTGRLKVNMKKMPPEIQKKLMQAMKKKRG